MTGPPNLEEGDGDILKSELEAPVPAITCHNWPPLVKAYTVEE